MRRGERLGQVHRWFFFEPIVESIQPVPDGDEFSNWTWMPPDTLIDVVVEFRKQPYRQVLGG
jgi:8-oxo-dGTP pyrophosphatase MutT (NUDIX family)